jgi:hypothetical protein
MKTSIFFYELEKSKFIFIGRTGVRAGGFNGS